MQPSFPDASRQPSQAEIDESLQSALRWRDDLQRDPDLAGDVRLIVPVYAPDDNGPLFQWANLGVRILKLRVTWLRQPEPVGTDELDAWQSPDHVTYYLPVTIWTEVATPMRVYTRDEFRGLCDRYGTVASIRAALEGRLALTGMQRRILPFAAAGCIVAVTAVILMRRRRSR